MQRKISALIGASLLVTAFLGFGSTNVGAADAGKVDIKVDLSYNTDHKVWEANNVATDGVWPNQRELLGSTTPTSNLGSLGGSVDVDIEVGVDNTQISLFTNEANSFTMAKITLTGDMFGTLSTFVDGLFVTDAASLVIDNSVPGTVVLTWTSDGSCASLAEGGESVFNLTAPVVSPPTSIDAGQLGGIPATGSNSSSVALIAALTLLAGGALVLTTRRRMHHG